MSGVTRLVELVHATYPVYDQLPPPPETESLALPPGVRARVPPWLSDPGDARIVEVEDGDEITLSASDVIDAGRGYGGGGLDSGRGGVSPDVYAYYLPFHFYSKGKWGIYIWARGIAELTSRLLRAKRLAGTKKQNAVARIAYRYLLLHEAFHYLTEVAITRFEVVSYEPAHLLDPPYRRNFDAVPAVLREEALANAFAVRDLERFVTTLVPYASAADLLGRIARDMAKQPPGYRAFERYVAREAFDSGRDALFDEVKRVLQVRRPLGGEDGLLPGRAHYAATDSLADCPVRIVLEPGAGVSVLRPFPKQDGMQVFVYVANEHLPPHFHLFMPPEREYGKYQWPSLEPVDRESKALSRKQLGKLRGYLKGCQPEIYQKICMAFPGTADLGE